MEDNIKDDIDEIFENYNNKRLDNLKIIQKLYENNNENNNTANINIYKVKLALYNIYDGILSSIYGADDILVSYIYTLLDE